MERLTYFNKYPGYKASNPVVSDDGRFMAFQMAQSQDPAGVGYGIFLYDFKRPRAVAERVRSWRELELGSVSGQYAGARSGIMPRMPWPLHLKTERTGIKQSAP